MNSVNIIGNISFKNEMFVSDKGTKILNLQVALNGKNNKVDFVTVRFYEDVAERIDKHTQVGSRIGVTGRLVVDQWTAQDGTKRERCLVSANQFYFAESKKK